MNVQIIRTWKVKGTQHLCSLNEQPSGGRFPITAIWGDAPRTPSYMMDWKYSIISGASLQCLSRIFFLGRKPIFPQELRHFNLPRRAENGITIEARTPDFWRGHPALGRELPTAPEASRARRDAVHTKPVYWLDAEHPMPYKLGRTENKFWVSVKYS